MRRALEKNLEAYSDLAKGELHRDELSARRLERLTHAVDYRIEQAASGRKTSERVQRTVLDLQKEKQCVMERLYERFRALDDPEATVEVPKGARSLLAREDGALVTSDGETVSHGELITDLAWGVDYAPDATVSRAVRKRYYTEAAKYELRALLNEQVIVDEVGSERTYEGYKEAYRARAEEGNEMHTGLIAETMVCNMLKKLAIDHDVDFTVEEADIYDDVVRKIDFIIHRKTRARGVGVEASSTAEDIGVQFTINSDPEVLAHKQEQVQGIREHLDARDPVDDIVLVTLPIPYVREYYETWARAGKPPGGPDKLWPPSAKDAIARRVLDGILPLDEINNACAALAA